MNNLLQRVTDHIFNTSGTWDAASLEVQRTQAEGSARYIIKLVENELSGLDIRAIIAERDRLVDKLDNASNIGANAMTAPLGRTARRKFSLYTLDQIIVRMSAQWNALKHGRPETDFPNDLDIADLRSFRLELLDYCISSDTLRAQNAELATALKNLFDACDKRSIDHAAEIDAARAALANVQP